MSFLNPWALALAALAAVPLILHLFRTRTRQRVEFPAVRYLRSAHRDSARALRLRDRLLMIVRVALLAVLAFAAAAPIAGRGSASDHWPTDVAVIIDNSGSMNRVEGAATLLDGQLSRARVTLEHAGPEDRFWLLAGGGDLLASAAGPLDVESGLDRVRPSDGTANLAALVSEALRLLPAGGDRQREIHVHSDFQRTAIAESLLALPSDVNLVLSRLPSSDVNGAVTRVDVEPPAPGGGGNVAAHLEAFGIAGTDTVEARLVIADETAGIARAPRAGTVAFRIPTLPEGEYPAYVEIPPSGLRADDRRSFMIGVAAPPSVAHVGNGSSYVAKALSVLAEAGRIRSEVDGGTYGVLVVEGWASSTRIGRLGNAVRIFIPPSDELRVARFNSLLAAEQVPWELALEDAMGEIRLDPRGVSEGLAGVAIRRRYLLRNLGSQPDSVWLRAADGEPWLVGGRSNGRPYLVLGSALTPEATNLPIDVAMVPFMERLLFRWATLGGTSAQAATAGERLTLPPDADSVTSPGGITARVDGDAPYVPLRAGIHTVYSDRERSFLAVAAPAAESDLAALAPGSAARRLGVRGARTAHDDDDWLAGIYGARRGASLLPMLLATLVLLGVTEILLATPGGSKRRRRERRSPGSASA